MAPRQLESRQPPDPLPGKLLEDLPHVPSSLLIGEPQGPVHSEGGDGKRMLGEAIVAYVGTT
jgi:hypothetical protein